MTLGEKQRLFTKLVAELVLWAYEHDFELSYGEAYRTPEQAALNAQKGTGIANSLHTKRLAVDFNLFVDGVYKTTTEAHRPVGEHWETMHELCRWGGRFKDSKGRPKPDGGHYSLTHGGVA